MISINFTSYSWKFKFYKKRAEVKFDSKILYYDSTNCDAILKYMTSAKVSTTVVISGPAIIAGSILSLFASSGNTPPMTFASITISSILIQTVSDTFSDIFSKKYNLKKLIDDSITPTKRLMRNSFHIIFAKSLSCNSPRASPLMIRVDACEPAFPPVSISIGIKDANITTELSTSS